MVKVALDAMGGDNAPSVVVEGAVKAVEDFNGDLAVILAGPEKEIKTELARLGQDNNPLLTVVDAPDLVAMDESPSTVLKNKPNSGLVTCVALQKKGLVDASISAGNSGAMMAASLMLLGRIGKVSRPAIACLMPSQNGTVIHLDCGANLDEKPQTLVDWAICGSVFAEYVLGYDKPKVGLLNIGEEEKKGPEVLQEANKLLKKAPVNFIGNIEGRDVVKGTSHVVVTGGFAGNIVLKLMEGFHIFHKEEFGEIDSPAGRRFEEGWNYDNIGGGLLLGLNGHCIISHGSANAQAIRSALKTAHGFAKNQVASKIAEKIAKVGE